MIKENQELLNAQLAQAMDTYRTQLSLLVTIITILVVANATVIGYAISTKIASVIFIGPLFPIVIIVVSRVIFKLSLPVVYTAINIESKYDSAIGVDWLASTFIAVTITSEYYDNLVKISLIKDHSKRIKALGEMPRPSFKGTGSRFIKIALFLIIVGQLVFPIILYKFFGWTLL
jgi:hypothetical protein